MVTCPWRSAGGNCLVQTPRRMWRTSGQSIRAGFSGGLPYVFEYLKVGGAKSVVARCMIRPVERRAEAHED